MYMATIADPAQAEFFPVYLLEFLPSSLSNPELLQALRRRNERLHVLFRAVLDDGVASGHFRTLDSGDVPDIAAEPEGGGRSGVRPGNASGGLVSSCWRPI